MISSYPLPGRNIQRASEEFEMTVPLEGGGSGRYYCIHLLADNREAAAQRATGRNLRILHPSPQPVDNVP